jgi:putative transposase
MKIIKAYKIRCYPTREQEILFAHTEGSCRYVYNRVLREMGEAYQAGEKKSVIAMSRQVTQWKRDEETAWLAEVPSDAIGQELRDLDRAFQNFFAGRAKYPKKHKKHYGCAIRLSIDPRHAGKVRAWANQQMILPGFGMMRLAQPKRLPTAMPKLVSLRRDAAGRFFAAFAVEQEVQILPMTGQAVGIDVNIKHLAVCSDGQKVEGAKALKRKLRHLRIQGRRLSRKVKGSNRWQRQKRRVGRIHARIADMRADRLHQLSHKLTQKFDVIALEDLFVKGMMRNPKLARHLADQSFGNLRRLVEYKAAWRGRQVILAGRWDATSKTCSECGHKLAELSLNSREWDCPACGAHHDRDVNAARNVLAFAAAEGNPVSDARGGWTTPTQSSESEARKAPSEARTECAHAADRMDRAAA